MTVTANATGPDAKATAVMLYCPFKLGDRMRLFYGDKAPGQEKTASDFNELTKKRLNSYARELSLLPNYFHVEPVPEEKKEETPAARPAPALPEGKFILTARCRKTKGGKNYMEFTWNEARNVDGYDLFLRKCVDEDKTFRVAATVMTGSACKVILDNLEEHVAYKGFVKPFVIVNGEKQYPEALGETPRVHFYTAYRNKSGSRRTPTRLALNKKRMTVVVGKRKKIEGTIKFRKFKHLQNGKPLKHVDKLRYYSSNEAVARVNKKGKVTGVAPGTCKVYVVTTNGIYKTVDVTVVDKKVKAKKKN